jgi:type I restriction enzyme S subunit
MSNRRQHSNVLIETEIGRIPEDWGLSKLSNIAQVIVSNVDKKFEENEAPVLLCNYMDVYQNEYITSNLEFMRGSASEAEIDKFSLRRGDVLITKDSETAEDIASAAVLADEIQNLICGYHLAILRPNKERMDSYFLAKTLQLDRVHNQFVTKANGVTRYGLTLSVINNATIPVPPLIEQAEIARILSTWDRAIERVQRLIEAKQRQKKGLMQGLLTGKLRFPEFGEPVNNIDEIPNGWSLLRLNQIGSLKAGGTPSTFVPQYWGGEIPWMNSGELNLKFVDSVNGRITEVGMNNSNTSMVPRHSVLVGLAGQGKTRGTVAVNEIPLCTNQSIAAIMPNEQRAHYLFLYYNLDSRYQELRRMSAGDGGRGGLTLSILGNMHIALPKIEEQLQIAQCLFLIDQNIMVLESKKQMLIRQKEGLMQKLLTGEIRVKVD